MAARTRPIYSEGENTEELQQVVGASLIDGGGRWTLSKSGKGLERESMFGTFKKTWEFMNIVASECVKKGHHPEWSNAYNKTFIRWTTHSPLGPSSKDISMAQFCDEQAEAMGELEETGPEKKLNAGDNLNERSLADRVVEGSADCCIPGTK